MYLKRKIMLTLIVTIILVCVIGFSYAKFMPVVVEGNNNINTIIGSTSDGSGLEPTFTVTYENGDNIIDSVDMRNGNTNIVKMKIASTYTASQNITIRLKTITNNTITGNYILYSCTQSNYNEATISNVNTKCTSIGSGLLPKTNQILKLQNDNYVTISRESTNYYILYSDIISNENSYYGNIIVRSYYTNSLENAILAKYTPTPDNVASEYVTSATGISFGSITSLTNGWGLYINSKANVTNDYTQGTIKYFRGGDICTNSSYTTEVDCQNNGATWKSLNNYVSFGQRTTNLYRSTAGPTYTSLASCQAAYSGQYICNTLYEDGDPIIWRIIRINSDGSIRLIDNVVSVNETSLYNPDEADAKYVGYTYGDSSVSTNDGTNSIVKDKIETWYDVHLNDYASYIVNSDYCNDTSGAITSFGGYTRMNAGTPTYSCPTTNKTYGGLYNLKVGLISLDEVLYAGSNASYGSYLKALGFFSWTMTPKLYNSTDKISMYVLWGSGSIYTSSTTNSSKWEALRAVINIDGDSLVTGNGTEGDPWIVQ